MVQSLAQLVDEITLDAHDIDEQLYGFLQVFHDEVATPLSASVLGTQVEVTGFDYEGDERRGLVARCKCRVTGTIALADVRFESHSVAGWLHAAYRTWLGLPSFPAQRPAGWAWPQP